MAEWISHSNGERRVVGSKPAVGRKVSREQRNKKVSWKKSGVRENGESEEKENQRRR